MTARRLNVAVSPELAEALEALATRRGETIDHLVEILLRENPVVEDNVLRLRERDEAHTLRRGRSLEKLILMGRSADRSWTERAAEGKVRLHAR